MYQFFQVMQMRALAPLPVTRFNFDESMEKARQLGKELAARAENRQPFAGLEERLMWYDSLPYLNLNRIEERRLLADLAVDALPREDAAILALNLVECDRLAAAGQAEKMAAAVTKVYEAAVQAFEKRTGQE